MAVVEEGQLKGAFRGFHDRETIFEFYADSKWRQNEYKYHYQYAYMPHAKGSNGKRWRPGACNTANTPLNILNQMSQILP